MRFYVTFIQSYDMSISMKRQTLRLNELYLKFDYTKILRLILKSPKN